MCGRTFCRWRRRIVCSRSRGSSRAICHAGATSCCRPRAVVWSRPHMARSIQSSRTPTRRRHRSPGGLPRCRGGRSTCWRCFAPITTYRSIRRSWQMRYRSSPPEPPRFGPTASIRSWLDEPAKLPPSSRARRSRFGCGWGWATCRSTSAWSRGCRLIRCVGRDSATSSSDTATSSRWSAA